jgi:alpha-tubulin suppressor-like RCC1 family protein
MHGSHRLAVLGVAVLGIAVSPLIGGTASSRAAPVKRAPTPAELTAHLAATSLAPAQASEIRLSFRFRHPSTRFSLLLERRQRAKWLPLRSVKFKGRFKGVRRSTVKKIFGSRALRTGRYRLRLSSDKNSVSLKFSIFAAEPITGASGVSAGGTLTCILIRGGDVECWGLNRDGELGNGTLTNSSTPIAVSGISGAIAVNSGYKHACVLLGVGTVSCWGYNKVGELGNGTLTNSSTPIAVNGLSGVVSSSSGAAHTCALLTGGDLYCWGDNEVGELGIGTLNRREPFGISLPVHVSDVSNVISVSAGFLHTCALISGGSIECWGYNRDGQVGDGTINKVRPYADPSPVHVAGITQALSISAGAFHTCALIAGGTVSCWGYVVASDFNPRLLLNSPVPVQVAGVKDAVAISSGGVHTCALIASGAVKCWGANPYGQLGNGNTLDSAKPVTVQGISTAVSISSGGSHSCAVLAGGAVKCWGRNDEGELGTGTLTASSVPISAVRPPASPR